MTWHFHHWVGGMFTADAGAVAERLPVPGLYPLRWRPGRALLMVEGADRPRTRRPSPPPTGSRARPGRVRRDVVSLVRTLRACGRANAGECGPHASGAVRSQPVGQYVCPMTPARLTPARLTPARLGILRGGFLGVVQGLFGTLMQTRAHLVRGVGLALSLVAGDFHSRRRNSSHASEPDPTSTSPWPYPSASWTRQPSHWTRPWPTARLRRRSRLHLLPCPTAESWGPIARRGQACLPLLEQCPVGWSGRHVPVTEAEALP